MKIVNQTTGVIISENAQYLTVLVDKTLGLLNPNFSRYLWFNTRFGIHTFGLKTPIDVLVLDKNYKVVYSKPNLLPWRIFIYSPVYNQVIELPANTINKNSIRVGDKIVKQNENK